MTDDGVEHNSWCYSHTCRSSIYRLPPMGLQTVQVSVEPRLSMALHDRSLVPESQRLSLCPSLLSRFPRRCFVKSRRDAYEGHPLSKLFSKAETLPFEKEININLIYSPCLKHAQEMLLGDQGQADQRTQSFHLPIVGHQSLDPAARALKLQAPCLLHALEHSPGSDSECVDALGLRAVEVSICMITRDFSVITTDVTGVSLSLPLSLYY